MAFFHRERTVVGVEIGTSKVIVAVGQIRDGRLTYLGRGESRAVGVRKGEVVDPKAAGESLREAVLQAEDTTHSVIEEVYLALSGPHLETVHQRARKEIHREGQLVTEDDIRDITRGAEQILLPRERLHVATLPRAFRVDGGEPVANPVGMIGDVLEGEFLVVHGVAGRLRNLISRVQEWKIDVAGYALSPVASADAVLTDAQKELGVLVIDMGAGLTHYAAFLNRQIETIGVLGVGGDHVTQDIAKAFNLPHRDAEQVKLEHGSVHLERGQSGERIHLKPAYTFPGRLLERDALVEVMEARWEETFSIIREQIGPDTLNLFGGGVVLTGGSSRTRGVDVLARRIFKKPVHLQRGHDLAGNVEELARPELSTALGMLVTGHRKLREELTTGSLRGRVTGVLKRMGIL